MADAIPQLRQTLSARQALLRDLRVRLAALREEAARPPVKATISDIQRRYLSAVADSEARRSQEAAAAAAAPVTIAAGADGASPVASLASRWDKGFGPKPVARVDLGVRGDVSAAKKHFAASDIPTLSASSPSAASKSAASHDQPAQLLVDDPDGVPSWANNQRKLVIRKENARSSIRDVDVRELQGSVLNRGSRDGSELKPDQEPVEARGNVKAALAIWGKTAADDAKELAKQKELEEKKAAEQLRLRKIQEEEQLKLAQKNAVDKFAAMSLTQLDTEPINDIELNAFLHRKIHLVNSQIADTEEQIEKAQPSQ